MKNKPDAQQIPDLKGKTKEEATETLAKAGLQLGTVTEEAQEDQTLVGKVIKQKPPPESPIPSGGSVDITIATKKETKVKVPDLKGKTKEEATETLAKAGLQLGTVTEEAQEDQTLVGKVIKQEPPKESEIASGGSVNITIIATKK